MLEAASFALLFRFNRYQQGVFFTTANAVAGKIYETEAAILSYFSLGQENLRLTEQNLQLERELSRLQAELLQAGADSAGLDSMMAEPLQEIRLIRGRVVHNSLTRRKNFLTLDCGSSDGVQSGQGVVSSSGVTGIVYLTSAHYSVVVSLLNVDSRISCKIADTGYFGTLTWDGRDARYAYLEGSPRHAKFRRGGRIPAPKAYKVYLEELLERGVISPEQTEKIRESFARRASSAESVVKQVADVISEFTDYTSVAVRDLTEETIENIGLFPCGDKALLLLRTDLRILKDSFISLPEGLEGEEVVRLSAPLQSIFGGRQMRRVREAEAEAMQAFAAYRELCRAVLDALFSYTERRDVALSGAGKSLARGEYDAEQVKGFLSLVEDKEKLRSLLDGGSQNIQIRVEIGGEAGVPDDCSLVTATYSADGRQLGSYGVVGPVRMDYAKVVSVLESVGEILGTMLKK